MEEKDLIVQLKSGNESAFRQLVATYQVSVYNTVLSLIQNNIEAEDIAQEVFMEIYQNIEKFRNDSKLSTWIYRIASNKALEHIRKRKASKRFAFLTSLFGKNDELEHQGTEFLHPGVLMEQSENARTLFFSIAKLPEKQQLAYTLCHVEGLSYDQICEVMELSKSSVESLLFRAKQNLKKDLETFYKTNFNNE